MSFLDMPGIATLETGDYSCSVLESTDNVLSEQLSKKAKMKTLYKFHQL
jgi:hypothetical protein